jgi:hypothetical protein
MKKELGDLVLKYFDGNVGLKTVPFVVKFRFGDSIIAFPVRDWKREKLFPVPCSLSPRKDFFSKPYLLLLTKNTIVQPCSKFFDGE